MSSAKSCWWAKYIGNLEAMAKVNSVNNYIFIQLLSGIWLNDLNALASEHLDDPRPWYICQWIGHRPRDSSTGAYNQWSDMLWVV